MTPLDQLEQENTAHRAEKAKRKNPAWSTSKEEPNTARRKQSERILHGARAPSQLHYRTYLSLVLCRSRRTVRDGKAIVDCYHETARLLPFVFLPTGTLLFVSPKPAKIHYQCSYVVTRFRPHSNTESISASPHRRRTVHALLLGTPTKSERS